MFRYLKELYLTWFVLGFRAAAKNWKSWAPDMAPEMNEGKGVAAVSLIYGINIMGIGAWIEMLLGAELPSRAGQWVIGITFLAIYLANYYVLVTRKYGIKFERNFTHLSKNRKVALIAGCVVMVWGTIMFTVYSVSVYQHFFHITPK